MSETPIPLPPVYTFGFVSGQVIQSIADTLDDPDRLPDARPAEGSVNFEPDAKLRKVLARPSAIVQNFDSKAVLHALTGQLVDVEKKNAVPVPVTFNEGDPDEYTVNRVLEAGIWLVTGIYKVTFSLTSGASIPPFNISVTDQHTLENPLDLATVSPFTPLPGAQVITLLVPANPFIGGLLGWDSGGLAWMTGTDATTASKGILQLAGDLAGTATSPTVPGLAGKADTTDPRFEDARTPTAHATSHATGGADPISPASIGAATEGQGEKADTAVQPAGLVDAFNTRIITGKGRPDIPATLTTEVADLVAVAPSSTEFRSTDGPQGAWVWMKRGASWVVTDGDTGRRKLDPSAVIPETSSQTILVLRTTDTVTISADTLTPAELVPPGPLINIPSGFTPQFRWRTSSYEAGNIYLYDNPNGTVIYSVSSLAVGRSCRFSFSYPAYSAWPTTLPGIPYS